MHSEQTDALPDETANLAQLHQRTTNHFLAIGLSFDPEYGPVRRVVIARSEASKKTTGVRAPRSFDQWFCAPNQVKALTPISG